MDGSGSNITLVGLLVDGLVIEEEGGREGRTALIILESQIDSQAIINDVTVTSFIVT